MENEFVINSGDLLFAKIEPHTPNIIFTGKDGIEILRLEPNGDIFVNGKLAENDKQIVDGLRNFLFDYGY